MRSRGWHSRRPVLEQVRQCTRGVLVQRFWTPVLRLGLYLVKASSGVSVQRFLRHQFLPRVRIRCFAILPVEANRMSAEYLYTTPLLFSILNRTPSGFDYPGGVDDRKLDSSGATTRLETRETAIRVARSEVRTLHRFDTRGAMDPEQRELSCCIPSYLEVDMWTR